MPIRTKIHVEADSDKFKASFALFQKYQAALKAQPAAAGFRRLDNKGAGKLFGLDQAGVNFLDQAVRSQTQFATAAQKADHAFRGLGTGVVRTLEGFARIALSPLELLFPAGLAVGLLGLGAGLVGGGSLYGLERSAAGVSDRRRQAMGLGVSYGALSSFDINFARFGVGQETLEAVAGGVYDFTSPAYAGLMNAGALGHGDTSEATIDLIRSIPKLFKNTPDEMTGVRARSLGLPLDMQSIIRLKNHPEEIEDQVKRYQQDRKTLDISTGAQEKWSSFTAAMDRAGRDIETVLGKNLVSLADPLAKVSADMVNVIDALVDSGTITDAIKGIETGLSWLTGAIGSSEFKQHGRDFLEAMDRMSGLAPLLITLVQIEGVIGLVPGFGALLRSGKLAGVNAATLGIGAGLIQKALTGHWNDPLTGANKRLAQTLHLEPPDAQTKVPTSLLRRGTGWLYSGGSGGGRGWNKSVGDIPADVLAQVQAANPNLTPRQCVELVQSTMGVGNVHDWRRGVGERDAPEGSALATFGVNGDSNLYAYGGSGTPGIRRDHALKMIRKYPDGSFDAVSQDAGHAPHLIHMPYTGRGGEGDAGSYYRINNRFGRPAGRNVGPLVAPAPGPGAGWSDPLKHGAGYGRSDPINPTFLPNWRTPGNIEPVFVPYPSHPGTPTPAMSPVDLALGESAEDRFAEMQRNRNRSLKYHGSHILDAMDRGPPPGPIVIHDMTGGSAHVTISRHEATQ